jgi:hypothetical protein
MLINGTEVSETLTGTEENDTILGGWGYDTLYGLGGDDWLNGQELSDFLTGGLGADSFVFDMTRTVEVGGTFSFADWREANGMAALQDGVTTQGSFSSSYSNWLSWLVAEYELGADVDGDGVVEVDINQNDPDGTPLIEGMAQADLDAMFGERTSLDVKTGKTTHERWYSDTIVIPDEVTIGSTSGTDVVMDFDSEEGDKLVLTGITAADVEAGLVFTEFDGNADGTMDTVIVANADNTFSVTLLGVTGLDLATDVMFA